MLKAICKEGPPPYYGRIIELKNEKLTRVANIQTAVSGCCGLNSLFFISSQLLNSPERVKTFFDDLADEPWVKNFEGTPPHYTIKHFIFTCGMGKNGPYNREEPYKYLIADPRVKLISRVPSASEPEEGYDIGIFLLDLS